MNWKFTEKEEGSKFKKMWVWISTWFSEYEVTFLSVGKYTKVYVKSLKSNFKRIQKFKYVSNKQERCVCLATFELNLSTR